MSASVTSVTTCFTVTISITITITITITDIIGNHDNFSKYTKLSIDFDTNSCINCSINFFINFCTNSSANHHYIVRATYVVVCNHKYTIVFVTFHCFTCYIFVMT